MLPGYERATPRGQGRTARGTEVSFGPRVIRLFLREVHHASPTLAAATILALFVGCSKDPLSEPKGCAPRRGVILVPAAAPIAYAQYKQTPARRAKKLGPFSWRWQWTESGKFKSLQTKFASKLLTR